MKWILYWLVVSTHLKNIGHSGWLPQVRVKIIIFWNLKPPPRNLLPSDFLPTAGISDACSDASELLMARSIGGHCLKEMEESTRWLLFPLGINRTNSIYFWIVIDFNVGSSKWFSFVYSPVQLIPFWDFSTKCKSEGQIHYNQGIIC